MRGSGKTTVGKLLAKKTGFKFVECDKLLEKSAGEKIPAFVAKNGWIKFRDLESNIIKEVISKADNTIISTGGGVVERSENINHLKKNGFMILLHAEVDILFKRICKSRNRPLLTGAKSVKEDLRNALNRRKMLYEKSADLIIDVANKEVDKIADEIIMYLKNREKL